MAALLVVEIVELMRAGSTRSPSMKPGLRFESEHHKRSCIQRSLFAVMVVGVAVVCYAHAQHLGPLGGLAKWTYVTLSVIMIAVDCLPASTQRKSSHDLLRRWWMRTIVAVSYVFILIPLVAIVLYATRALDFDSHDIRAGALLALVFQLLILLAAAERPSTVLVELRQLRRDLMLNRCSVAEAVARFEAATSGMRLDDVLRAELREFQELERLAHRLLTDAHLLVDLARSMPTRDRVSSARGALERLEKCVDALSFARMPVEGKVRKFLVHTEPEVLKLKRGMYESIMLINRQCVDLWEELDGIESCERASGSSFAADESSLAAGFALATVRDARERPSDKGVDKIVAGEIDVLVRESNDSYRRLIAVSEELEEVHRSEAEAAASAAASKDEAHRRIDIVHERYRSVWDLYARARRIWCLLSAELLWSRTCCELKGRVDLSGVRARVDTVELIIVRLEKEFRVKARLSPARSKSTL
ncbi:hypothetical protein [Sorangium sp. So ce1024]|uniref:hypothetical protein n=1 Tax=Sorangium sp. So ce1024 TaxID=3133327 RepID=UPI003F00A952